MIVSVVRILIRQPGSIIYFYIHYNRFFKCYWNSCLKNIFLKKLKLYNNNLKQCLFFFQSRNMKVCNCNAESKTILKLAIDTKYYPCIYRNIIISFNKRNIYTLKIFMNIFFFLNK